MKKEEIILTPSQKAVKMVLEDYVNGRISSRAGALKLGITKQGFLKKIRKYKEKGDLALIHGSVGKKRWSKKYIELDEKIKKIFVECKTRTGRQVYENVTYTLMQIILSEEYNINVSVPFVKKVLNSIGYYTPYHHKERKDSVHLLRPRREMFGSLLQTDATPYDWFGTGKQYALHAFVDDATGLPCGLWMCKNECLLGYVEAFRMMALKYGLPESVYSDKAAVFFIVKNAAEGIMKDRETQFGKMMRKLGVELIPAFSSQAKGRIERFWWTVQNQLPVLFRMNEIDTIEKANEYLNNEFSEWYRKRYTVKAISSETSFVAVEKEQIRKILKAVFIGHTDNSGMFSLCGYKFLCTSLVSQKIKICLSDSDGLWVEKINDPNEKRYSIILCETDTTGTLADVYKDLIERTFLQNAKPKYREVYFELDASFLK